MRLRNETGTASIGRIRTSAVRYGIRRRLIATSVATAFILQSLLLPPRSTSIALAQSVPKPALRNALPIGGVAPVPSAALKPSLPPKPQATAISSASSKRLSNIEDVQTLLHLVPLGAPLTALRPLGDPWFVAHEEGLSFWTYSIDRDHSWLVFTVRQGVVDSVQALPRARTASGLRDGARTFEPAAGQSSMAAFGASALRSAKSAGRMRETITFEGLLASGARQFSGSDQFGTLTRIGITRNGTAMPSIVRWYEQSGWSPERAIEPDAYQKIGEDKYLAQLNSPNFECSGGSAWRILERNVINYGGVPVDRIRMRCGRTNYRAAIYFAQGERVPHGYDEDKIAQTELSSGVVARSSGYVRASLYTTSLERQGSIVPAPQATGSQVGKIWFTSPNGRRCNPNISYNCDLLLSYVDDPANPLQSVTLSDGGPPPNSPNVMHLTSLRRSTTALKPNAVQSTCSFSGGSVKCAQPSPNGQQCATANANFGTYSVIAGPVCQSGPSDPQMQPHGHDDRPSQGCGGGPINYVSGKLWFAQPDFTLSGPYGLAFAHRYDSDHAVAPTQTVPQHFGALGVGWRHSYDIYLDVPTASAPNASIGLHTANCSFISFPTVNTNLPNSYDQYSGSRLLFNSDGTYTVKTWDEHVMNFTAAGLLTSMADRIGNTQTLARDAQQRISTITDGLGRSANFQYDTQNRISSVATSPAGGTASFTYDSGTNCYSGDLCTVKEADGATWTYQYYDPSQTNTHLLEYVVDPLGHIAEYNKYSQIQLGNGDDHYRVVHQEQQGGANAYDLTYAYSGNSNTFTTTVSDALGSGHSSVYTWDELLQEVLSVSGYQCRCNGAQLNYSYDSFGRLLTLAEGPVSSPQSQAVRSQSFYGRDVVFTSPDGNTTYSATAYPSPSEIDEPGIQTSTGPVTRQVKYSYYPVGDARQDLPQSQTEPSVDTVGDNVTSTFTYSTAGELTQLSRQGYVAGASTTRSISYTYESAHGRLQSIVGPRTDVTQKTQFAYHPDTDTDLARRGQLETKTDALGHVTSYGTVNAPSNTYNVFGSPLSVSDANGVNTLFTYDSRGRVTSSKLKGVPNDTNDLTTSLSYDSVGNVKKLTRPLANSLSLLYDGTNNLTNEIVADASGSQREQAVFGYDVLSQNTAKTLQSCTMPSSSCSTWATSYGETDSYTTAGNLGTATFSDGAATTNTWDTYGNLTATQVGNSSFSTNTTYNNDSQHDLTTVAIGQNGYDYADVTYDLQYNPSRYNPSNSPSTLYAFDDFGDKISENSPITGTTTNAYDSAGNLTSRKDANQSTTSFTYDALNRPLTSTSVHSGLPTQTVTWTYDSTTSGAFGIGRLASMTDPSGMTSYTYERHGFIASMVQKIGSANYATSYAYDGNGNRITRNLPSGRVLTYGFDFADRPNSVKSSTTTYVSAATYLAFGPLASLAFGNGTTQTRSYTQRYLPSEIKLVAGATTVSDVKYQENGAGYVTAAIDALNAGFSHTYQYGGNAGNVLTEADTGSSLWTIGQFTDSYADNLSTEALPHRNYGFTYNSAPQLTSVFDGDANASDAVTHDAAGNQTGFGTNAYAYSTRNLMKSGDGITYQYDGFGQRVQSTLPGQVRASLYDPERHLQSESSLTATSVAYDYIWLGSTPVAQEDVGGSTHWTATDQLGTPFLQTTATGTVYWQADYTPYGEVYSLRTADRHEPLRFPGQEAQEFNLTDGPNGHSLLFYNGARWYQPAIGRYAQPDPIEYANNPFNLYSYAFDNPTSYIDPIGLQASPNYGASSDGGSAGSPVPGSTAASAPANWENQPFKAPPPTNCGPNSGAGSPSSSFDPATATTNGPSGYQPGWPTPSPYAQLSGEVGFFGGIQVSGTISNGRLYFAVGVVIGAIAGVGVSLEGGIVQPGPGSSANDVLTGGSYTGSAGAGGGVQASANNSGFSVGGGATTPGVTFGYVRGFGPF